MASSGGSDGARRRGDGYEESEEGTAGLRRRWAESGSGVVRETRRAEAVRKGDMERAARRCAQQGASEREVARQLGDDVRWRGMDSGEVNEAAARAVQQAGSACGWRCTR